VQDDPGCPSRTQTKRPSALSTVTDPELDEPITDLGFVKDLSISNDGRVSLDLVTSTFWCSPNFVYMMLEEARDVVSKLGGINEVRVHLDGHHDSDRINEAINAGKSFSDLLRRRSERKLGRAQSNDPNAGPPKPLFSMAMTLSKHGFSPEQLSISRSRTSPSMETRSSLGRQGPRSRFPTSRM